MAKTIYLAGGCFWGTQQFMSMIHGVKSTQVGYANSTIDDPSYRQVCTGLTNAAETVKVEYWPSEISLETLLALWFQSIDPLSVNRQGNDIGTQYRTGIYYIDDNDLAEIQKVVDKVEQRLNHKLAVEVEPLINFFPAEEYHQDYLIKNPNGYCHISPRTFQIVKEYNKKVMSE